MQDQVLGVVIAAMTTNLELWHCYFKDFITYKLSLVDQSHTIQLDQSRVSLTGDFAQQILHNYFEYLDKYDVLHRMAELHNMYQLQIAKTATILRPLIKIGRVSL